MLQGIKFRFLSQRPIMLRESEFKIDIFLNKTNVFIPNSSWRVNGRGELQNKVTLCVSANSLAT